MCFIARSATRSGPSKKIPGHPGELAEERGRYSSFKGSL